MCNMLNRFLSGFVPEHTGYLQVLVLPAAMCGAHSATAWLDGHAVGAGAEGLTANRTMTCSLAGHIHTHAIVDVGLLLKQLSFMHVLHDQLPG